MRQVAWSLLIGGLAGLGAGPFFAATAFAQKGGGGGHFGNAMPGSPLGNQQMLLPPGINPVNGVTQSPGSISPTIGGVNSRGAVVGGTSNGGFYSSPGSFSAAFGGVSGNGSVVGGYLNNGNYGVSPGMNISPGMGGVNGSGAVVGGYLNGGVYGSPGSIISPAIGGVNGSGALVGGTLNGGRYGSPGSFSPTTGGVNGRGAAIAGTLNSGFKGFQNGIGANGEFIMKPNEPYRAATPVGITGANFFPGSAAYVAPTGNIPVAIVNPETINPPISTVNPAPLFVETVEGGGGNFQYSWW